MNKKLATYFSDNGFTVNGNEAYGFVKNFETSVYFLNSIVLLH